MKRFLFTLIVGFFTTFTLSAQDIYQEIRQTAQNKLNDPNIDPVVRQFNLFKVEALNYMVIKMKEEIPDSSATLLDKEALALNAFLNLYTESLVECRQLPVAHQKKVILAFIEASCSNPLFNDTDQELVLAFFNDKSCITRFSLDTEWLRATLAAKEKLKQLK